MRLGMLSWVLVGVLLAAFVPAVAAQTPTPDLLAGTEWQLVTLGDSDVVADSHITLVFGSDGTLAGNSGCNNYSSSYTQQDGNLTLTTVFSTRRACESREMMAQERAYQHAIQSASTVEVNETQLTITTADGEKLVFALPSAEQPVDGALNYDEIPQSRTEDGAFVLGDPAAALTVVEFADFTCPHCQDYHADIQQFIRTYVATGKAKLEYRMIRATGNPNGDLAAQLAECADTLRPGSFWKAQDRIYEIASAGRYDALTTEVAQLIDVSADDLTTCTATTTRLQTDSQVAQEAGVTGTPAVMVRINDGPMQWINANGQILNSGGIPFDYLAQIVEYVMANP